MQGPVGTLAINIGGSFVLGFLLRYALGTPAVSAEARAFLTAGFCGGFTIMYRANVPPERRTASWQMDMSGLWDADTPEQD